MADGYALASGKPGVVNLHTIGGLGHGVGAIHNAMISSTPLVITAGQQDLRHTLKEPLLVGDTVKLVSSITKSADEARSVDDISLLARRAFLVSQHMPKGPVFLSLPMNTLQQSTEQAFLNKSTINHHPVAGGLESLAQLLIDTGIGKLAIVIGDECEHFPSYDKLVEFSELFGAAVYGSSWPKTQPFPNQHPLWQGSLPPCVEKMSETLSSFETVLVLGGYSFIPILYADGSALPPNCKLLQISMNTSDLGHVYPSQLSCVGDIYKSVDALIKMINEHPQHNYLDYKQNSIIVKNKTIERKVNLHTRVEMVANEPIIHPLTLAAALCESVGDTAIIDEGLAISGYIKELLDIKKTKQYYFLRGAALGWGMPAAVGYSLGLGRKPVISLVGDGAAMYSPQSIWTAMNEKLPVTFVVINNQEYNILKNYMRSRPVEYSSAKTDDFIAMDINDPPINFKALAKSMGMPAQTVSNAEDLKEVFKSAIESRQPNLIEVIVSAEQYSR